MKKSIITLSCICLLMLLSLTGCVRKTSITTEHFKSIAQNHNYTISDATSKYSVYGYIDEATVAGIANKWQVEFYVLDTEANANNMFNTNKEIFETYKSNSSAEKYNNFGNSARYVLTSSGYYMYLRRINNTLIYAKVPTDYQDTAKDFIKELGY